MNFVRAHRRPLAWILFGFVLLNGLLCSISHGLMVSSAQSVSTVSVPDRSSADLCGDEHAVHGADAATGEHHGVLMQLAMFDCVFAGKLLGALVLAAGLVRLLRALPARLLAPIEPGSRTPRQSSPELVPQAP